MNNVRRTQALFAISLPLLILLLAGSTQGQTDPCANLQRMIRETYNFRPAQLNGAQRTAKSNEMDRVWAVVEKDRTTLLPCLRGALTDPKSDPFFLFDGSNLLVSLDDSRESKLELIRAYTVVDLADVDLRMWVTRLAFLGSEGFDISEPADRWLRFPKAFYYLPEHGAYKVTLENAAMFLFGSMDESQATPALLKILSDKSHPRREIALWALMNQATPESIEALRQINPSEFSSKAQSSLNALLTKPKLFQPRAKPKNTRQEFVKAFEEILTGDSSAFFGLVSQVPDGEKDVVAVLKPEDLPLVRRVRRRIIAGGSQHAMEFYKSFTSILMTLIRKPAPAQ